MTGLLSNDPLDWNGYISQLPLRSKIVFLAMLSHKISTALHSRWARNITGYHYKPAAVLMPIQERDDGDYLILTRRAEHLSRHSGQIAFPGGRVDSGDAGHMEAALRESQEEIGLDPAHVKVLGRMDQVMAAYNYVVTPFVGLIPPAYDFRPDPAETAEVFAVPIGALLEPQNVSLADHGWSNGATVYHFQYRQWDIWGATANMIVQFLDLVYGYKAAKN
jgi:8-oxo-dGTP pyrophosphatase MutT (NUDIX family)